MPRRNYCSRNLHELTEDNVERATCFGKPIRRCIACKPYWALQKEEREFLKYEEERAEKVRLTYAYHWFEHEVELHRAQTK